MKYFIDTEFMEGSQNSWFGKTKPTIDLISIAIVCEDGREYYTISKDFNLKEAWNKFQWKDWHSIHKEKLQQKEYWIRDNILKPIFIELLHKEYNKEPTFYDKYNNGSIIANDYRSFIFNFKEFKRLINKFGKTNKQIAEEIKHFVANRPINSNKEQWILDYDTKDVQFYGYYSDYDWVVFCWLFGKMIDLPNGFPMYCIDLKQDLDKTQEVKCGLQLYKGNLANDIKKLPNYPKQTNEHNALSDARWNKQLYEFLIKL